jgi:hypothetical protein
LGTKRHRLEELDDTRGRASLCREREKNLVLESVVAEGRDRSRTALSMRKGLAEEDEERETVDEGVRRREVLQRF